MADNAEADEVGSHGITPAEQWLEYTPDWRWRQANQVIQGRAKPQDGLVRDVAGYLKVRNHPRMTDEHRWYRLVERMYASKDPSATRWYVEALLLTDATDEEIGGAVGLPPRAIGLYHDLFYEVRPHRTHLGLLQSAAMQRLNCEVPCDSLWKRIGLECGKDALYLLWGGAEVGDAQAKLDRFLTDSMRRAAVLASEQLSHTSPHNADRILEQYMRATAADRKSRSQQPPFKIPHLEFPPMAPGDDAIEPVRLPTPAELKELMERLRGGGMRSSA